MVLWFYHCLNLTKAITSVYRSVCRRPHTTTARAPLLPGCSYAAQESHAPHHRVPHRQEASGVLQTPTPLQSNQPPGSAQPVPTLPAAAEPADDGCTASFCVTASHHERCAAQTAVTCVSALAPSVQLLTAQLLTSTTSVFQLTPEMHG